MITTQNELETIKKGGGDMFPRKILERMKESIGICEACDDGECDGCEYSREIERALSELADMVDNLDELFIKTEKNVPFIDHDDHRRYEARLVEAIKKSIVNLFRND